MRSMLTGFVARSAASGSTGPSSRPTMYSSLGGNTAALINTTLALTTIGQFALVFFIATLVLSWGVYKRTPLVIHLFIITLFGTLPQYFLAYAGEIYNQTPPTALCAIQTALLKGAQCTLAVLSLSLVIDLLVEAHSILGQLATVRLVVRSRLRSLGYSPATYTHTQLVAAPYITFILMSSGVAAYGATHPGQVRHMPDDLACTLQNHTFITATQIVTATVLLLALSLQTIGIVHSLTVRTRRYHHRQRVPDALNYSQVARIVGFTCLQTLLLIFDVLRTYSSTDSVRVASVILHALAPLLIALMSGLTSETFQSWRRATTVLHWFVRRPGNAMAQEPGVASPSGRATPPAMMVYINIDVTVDAADDRDEHREPIKPIHVPLAPSVTPP
ncbi:hypothetical protein C8Q73DRAFT_682964 [Cubamyces lactineus]|nr:hypothetical protein C8Q73DRAFT_682964 [Cubamyces lactineus]